MSAFDINQWNAHVAAANAAAANAAAASVAPVQPASLGLTAEQSAVQAHYAAYQAAYGLGGAAAAPRPASVVTSPPADPQAAALAAFYASTAAAAVTPTAVKHPSHQVSHQAMMPTAHSGVESAHAALYQNAAAQAQLAAYQAAAARSATPQHAQPAVNQHQAVNPAAAHAMAAAAAAAAKSAQTSQAAHMAFNHHTALSQSQASIAAFGQSAASAVQMGQSQPQSLQNSSQPSYTPQAVVTTQQVTPVSTTASIQTNNTSHNSSSSASNGPSAGQSRFPNSSPRGHEGSRSAGPGGPGGYRPRGPPPDFRGPPSRGFGPRGPPPDFGPRGPPRGFRPRGPPPMDMDRFPPRHRGPWGPPDDGPPHSRWGPRDDGPPPGRWGPYDNGPPDRWGPPRSRFGRNRSPPRDHRRHDDERRPSSRHDKPPSLMDLDIGSEPRDDRGERRRKRSYPHDDDYSRHSSKHRHVDEDLNVTISGNDREEEKDEEDHQYYCTTCKVYLRNSSDFQQHLRGKRHKQRQSEPHLAWSEAGRKPGSAVAVSAEFDEGEEPMYTDKNVSIDPTLTLIPADDPEKSKLYCTSCRLSLVSEDNKLCHDYTPSHLTKMKELEELRSTKGEDQELCVTCHVLYKKAEDSEHKASEKHQESLHWRMATCEICSVKYNSATSLESHMEQSKHAKQLAKIKKIGMEAVILTKYFQDLSQKQQEKRSSFCLICTTVCATNENMDIHNILAEEYHDRKIFKSYRASEHQFYCFCCEKIVEESDRRSHGKSQRHKNSKERKRRWSCEDCHEYFNDESALMSHLSSNRHCKQVQRRKKLQEHAKKQFLTEWKQKILNSRSQIIDKLPRINEGNGDAAGIGGILATEIKSGAEVIPVAGDFCTICNQFYMIGTDPADMCAHVRAAKGIELADESSEPEVEEFTEPIVKAKADSSIGKKVEKEDGADSQAAEATKSTEDPKAKSEADLQAKCDGDPEAKCDADPEAKCDADPEAKSEDNPKAKPDIDPEAKSKDGPEAMDNESEGQGETKADGEENANPGELEKEEKPVEKEDAVSVEEKGKAAVISENDDGTSKDETVTDG